MEQPNRQLTIGIDATNLRRGGGVTHLVELLCVVQPLQHGISHIVLWGGRATLNAVEERPWLDKRNLTVLDKGLLWRTLWQRFSLSQAVRDAGCDLLFVPGGSFAGNFHPVVTMSRNLLPFEFRELWRYGWTFFSFKLLLLRLMQSRSYRKADGLIFLTDYARQVVLGVVRNLDAKICTIPHGLNSRFNQIPKHQHSIEKYNDLKPYRILYVSIVDQYKHQWSVVEAVVTLRERGLPVVLDLVGPAYPPALKRLSTVVNKLDRDGVSVHYHGAIPFHELHYCYLQADLGLFASSCENLPNILLETMAAGLPVACSNRGPMPEILGDAGLYFDPLQPQEIAVPC